mgnify:CR=1 FL=1
MSASRPDIVLLLSDQHAARVLGCAGDPVAETPALDRLAATGTRFDACYCPSPLCVPSRTALLSGLEPNVTGVLTNDDCLGSDVPTIAHAMTLAGYDCRLVGRMHFLGPDQLHGFGERPLGDIGPNWPGAPPPDIGPLTPGRGNRGPELEHSGRGETSYQAFDRVVAERAQGVLAELVAQRRRTGRPFFLLAGFFCPHPPFIAARDDYDAFDARVPPPRLPTPDSEHPVISAWREAGQTAGLSAGAIARSRTAYYALVRMIDRLCGSVIDAVDAAGLDDAVTIYASDHGESLGERGLWWKSTMYEQSARVPLICRGPGMPAGHVDERVTNLLDLSATLLGWAGAERLPGMRGRDLRRGVAVASGETPGAWPDETFSEYHGGLMNIALPPLHHRMVRQGRYKLIWYDGAEPQLFDLERDPDELTDLGACVGHAGIRYALIARVLDGWDPRRLSRRQANQAARQDVMRRWVRDQKPSEPLRWVDPGPMRNRYH